MDKEERIKAIYKDNELKDVYIRYKKETPSGYIWDEVKLTDIPEIIGVKKAPDYKGKPTINIKAYGKLEEIFQ